MKRLVLMGSDPIGLPLLAWLHSASGDRFHFAGVIGGPDRPAGRGKRLQSNPMAAAGRRLGLEVLQTTSPNREAGKWLRERKIDLVLVFAYGHILSEDLLRSVPLGFLNLHGSLLPLLRGPSPIEMTIHGRFKTAGLTLMQMVRAMDAGPIYGSLTLPLDGSETGPNLRLRVAELAPQLLDRYLDAILSGQLAPTPQDHRRATYCKLLRREDGLLDFRRAALDLESQVRAFLGWPGSFFMLDEEPVKVGAAAVDPHESHKSPGTILGLNDGALEIATGDGIFRCLQLQRPTRRMLPAELFWQGKRTTDCRSIPHPDAREN